MSQIKRIFAVSLVCFLLFSLVFSGCREKDPSNMGDYSGIELTYYKVFDDSDVMEPLIDGFISEHPGLKINYKKFSDFAEYQRVVLNEMAEGEGPDIFSMQNTWFASNYKKVVPMPETFGKPSDFESTFVDVAYRDLVLADENGYERIFGFPMTVDTLALYYNKAHFEDRLASKGKPSVTWEGIKEDVTALNKIDESTGVLDVSGIAMGRSDNIDRGVDILYLLFLQYGTKFYNDNISEAVFAGKQNVDYPGLKALDFYTSFADPNIKYYSWNETMADDDSKDKEIEAFARGDVSMIIGYAYTYDLILNYISVFNSWEEGAIDKDSVRIAPIPQLYDPKVSKEKRVAYASYFAEAVSRNSKYPELAWEFLMYLTEKKNLEDYFDATHKPTSRRDMIDDQKKDPVYGVFADQVGYAESFPILDYYTYKDLFSLVIKNVNDGNASSGSLVSAQEKITELLPKDGLIVPKAKDATNEKKTE